MQITPKLGFYNTINPIMNLSLQVHADFVLRKNLLFSIYSLFPCIESFDICRIIIKYFLIKHMSYHIPIRIRPTKHTLYMSIIYVSRFHQLNTLQWTMMCCLRFCCVCLYHPSWDSELSAKLGAISSIHSLSKNCTLTTTTNQTTWSIYNLLIPMNKTSYVCKSLFPIL